MPTFFRRLALIAAVIAAFSSAPFLAHAQSDQQMLIDRAATTIEAMKADPAFEQLLALMQQARGVVIVPALVKAGFIVGGAGGAGVLLGRDPATGVWSDPAFVDIGAASLGFQAGAEVAEVVIVIATGKGLDALLANRVSLSAEAGLVVGTHGGERELGSALALDADLYAFSKSKGLFVGMSIEGAVMMSDEDWNAAYYGQSATTRSIVVEHALSHPGSQSLKNALAEIAAAPL